MTNPTFIYITQNSPATQYRSFGQPPYPTPAIAHPIINTRLVSRHNHQLVVELDTTQSNDLPLDLVVEYQLFLAPRESHPKPVSKGSILILTRNKTLELNQLLENRNYQLELEFYNPYYPQIAATSSSSYQTTNLNVIDLLHQGPQNQDRDNSLTLTLTLPDKPENISLQLQEVKQESSPPLLQVNFASKPGNSEIPFQITNIPDGLYQLHLMDSTGQGLPKDFTLEKYDNGKTQNSIFPGNLGNGTKKTIMLVFGKLQFTSPFASNLSNLSSLTETQVRRSARRGAFLSTSGSFTLSSGGSGRSGNN